MSPSQSAGKAKGQATNRVTEVETTRFYTKSGEPKRVGLQHHTKT